MEPDRRSSNSLFRRPESWPEIRFVADALRTETVGGLLLIGASVVALIWANSPWRESYEALKTTVVGPAALHLDLDLATWAADGLLAIFFFVVGLELKRELTEGDLRDPRRAVVPVIAALGGVAVPALLYVLVNLGPEGSLDGWAIPTATDIAFALAVLAVLGSHLPAGLRSFLLTLAVVDDLVAILIIAVFFTAAVDLVALAGALACVAGFGWLARRRRPPWILAAVVGVAAWVLMHESGVHATIAGVLLGVAVPLHGKAGEPMIEGLEHRWRPISAGVAVPLFALLTAGVTFVGGPGLLETMADPVAIGILAGLVVGKPVGIMVATWLTATLTRAKLDAGITWSDLFGLSMAAGIGFTVSLLVGELAFGDTVRIDAVKLAVLTASFASALLAAVVLRRRNSIYRTIAESDAFDSDNEGVTDD
jgi:Na+:H+ antiporter, NhaA family